MSNLFIVSSGTKVSENNPVFHDALFAPPCTYFAKETNSHLKNNFSMPLTLMPQDERRSSERIPAPPLRLPP